MQECQTCRWRGKELMAPTSDSIPCCPECGGSDFLDVYSEEEEEQADTGEDDDRD